LYKELKLQRVYIVYDPYSLTDSSREYDNGQRTCKDKHTTNKRTDRALREMCKRDFRY